MYVNDLNNAIKSMPRLFADDTCLLISATNPVILQNKITDELERLNTWCSVNKLTINLSKTCTLIIPPKLTINSVLSTTTNHNVMRNHTPLNIVTNAKFKALL